MNTNQTTTEKPTFESLKTILDNKSSELFAKHGAFFAFSNKQFDEAKKEGIKYVSLGAGLIAPKDNAKQLVEEWDRLHNESIKQQVEIMGADAIIEYEYFNHETQITCDVSALIDVLESYSDLFPELFTKEKIKQISANCFQKAIDNDWF